jgi:tRNA-splicing ligase RtcB
MDTRSLIRRGTCEWEVPQAGRMLVPAVIYATEPLVRDMDEKVREQAIDAASHDCIKG